MPHTPGCRRHFTFRDSHYAIRIVRNTCRHLVPSLTLDESGNPSVQFGARSGLEPEPQIEDALEAPMRLAKIRRQCVVMVYDEIQRLSEFGDDLVERMLRSRIQAHSGVAYFFLGSRKNLIRQMFMEQNRPMYQSSGHYPLHSIGTEHWIPFIRNRFVPANKQISEALIESLCDRTGGHPYYTQNLAHALWEITPSGTAVTNDVLRSAEKLLLRRLDYTYTVLWETLSSNQRLLLQGISSEPPSPQPFSAAFLAKYGIPGSSAHRAVEGLLERDLVDRDSDGYFISDRFFRLWIMQL
jgi:uncharacterized protein